MLVRYLFVGVLVGCDSAPAPPPKPSAPAAPAPRVVPATFGETPESVPSWTLPQEARCPKMPDAPERWAALEQPRSFDELIDALLVCSVQIAAKNDPSHFPWGGWHPPSHGDDSAPLAVTGSDWDTVNGPDALIRFRIGTQREISFWGPEDHWAMYASIPRLTLHRGDSVHVDVWDRDITANEPISSVDTLFDGTFPWRFEAKWLRFDCRAATASETRQWASPLGAKIDKVLGALAHDRPEAGSSFRQPGVEGLKSSLRLFEQPNFRYYAGYLGWEAPEVQQRLRTLSALENGWPDKVRAAVAVAVSAATPLGKRTTIGRAGSISVDAVASCSSGACYRVIAEKGVDDFEIVSCEGDSLPAEVSEEAKGVTLLRIPTGSPCLLEVGDDRHVRRAFALRPQKK